MLKHLQKFFKAASAEQQEEVTEMATQEGQTVQAADTKAEELSAQLATATEALTALQGKFDEVNAKLEQATAALAAIEAEKAEMVAEATAKKLEARKAKVEMAIGENDKAEKLLAATEHMADEQFEAVVSALAGSMEAEAKSEMFKEVGVSASADASKLDVDPVQKLAANLAAKFK